MMETALKCLDEQDAFAAIERVCEQTDPLAAMTTFAELVRHLYWEKKDVHRMVIMAQAGIQFGLTLSVSDAHDANLIAQVRSISKGLAYNLGAFTWPGWDEPGIVLTEEHLWFGREAAKVNLRLAHELNKGDLPLSRACWLLGAHALTTGENRAAAQHFAEAIRYAQAAEAQTEALLNEGYQCLAWLLSAPNEAGKQNFAVIQNRLASVESGADLAGQLKTAWKVFGNEATET